MKKIAFVTTSLGGGGAERVTVSLANYFLNKGEYEVSIVIFNNDYDEYKVDDGIQLYCLPDGKYKLLKVFNRLNSLKKILKKINPDYLFSLGMFKYLFLGNLTKRYNCVLSERNDPASHSKFESYMITKCMEKSFANVFQTQEAMEFYNTRIQKNSVVIPNPLKDGLPKRYQGNRKKNIVAYSRLTRQKNIPMLLEVFEIVSKQKEDFVLDIFGEGSLKDELVHKAIELGINDKVVFHGFVSPIHEHIIDAAMFVSSSDFEGISNSMLESMAIGLPVVCTDCPIWGARMIIKNHQNGVLVPVNDPRSMAKEIIRIIDNPEYAEMLSINASMIREELSIKKIGSRWEQIIS